MRRSSLTGLDRRQLRRWLGVFFLALAIPTAVLIAQAYGQLKWEAFYRHRVLAEELAARVDARAVEFIEDEERRSFAEYGFLVVSGEPSASFIQRSDLSEYPVQAMLPGLVGYFQVDADGVFSSPLLPPVETDASEFGIGERERHDRLALQNQIRDILGRNRLVEARLGTSPGTASLSDDVNTEITAELAKSATETVASSKSFAQPAAVMEVPAMAAYEAEEPAALSSSSQAAFDELTSAVGERDKKQLAPAALGRVEDLRLDSPYADTVRELADQLDVTRQLEHSRSVEKKEKRRARKENSAVAELRLQDLDQVLAKQKKDSAPAKVRITTFESELDPFEFRFLDSGEFVLFRNVWREGRRYIQGALIDRDRFLAGVVGEHFQGTALSRMSSLAVAYQGDVFALFRDSDERGYLNRAAELDSALLYRTRLSAPLRDLELIFSITQLPAGPGATVLAWVAAILSLVLCSGIFLMYRLGARQIDLTRQQQDFVSAVSHELKTPLTSIRMYGEILREGWASEEKKKIYYDHIFHESERLSRLIGNVLQLARMTRNDLQVDARAHNVITRRSQAGRPRQTGRLYSRGAPRWHRPTHRGDGRCRSVYPNCHQPGRQCDQVFGSDRAQGHRSGGALAGPQSGLFHGARLWAGH